jgi:4-aminobutyrate aminotransferase / (S)-3-amino-2-methylpropionate transaminase / 5-aminovalerate transaminase
VKAATGFLVGCAITAWGVGGTYAASPLACAAALAAIDVIDEEGLVDRAEAIGGKIVKTVEGWAETDPRIGEAEVRGLGAMVGIESFSLAGSTAM